MENKETGLGNRLIARRLSTNVCLIIYILFVTQISFHMVVPRNGPNGDQYAAIDQIRLEEGPC